MADFKTHVAGSSLVGVGLGMAGYEYGIPIQSCLLAGGLCGVAGILPDLDSNSGIPYRESVAFISAFLPIMLIRRFQALDWTRESIVLACALLYLFIRFGVAELFRRYTVHRGMWHSIPAAASVGLLTFLITGDRNFDLRVYWTLAAMAGFITHLVLDELYSVDFRGIRLKQSFGTALKFWSTRGVWPNVSAYGKLILLAVLAWGDPMLVEYMDTHHPLPNAARSVDEHIEIGAEPGEDSIWR